MVRILVQQVVQRWPLGGHSLQMQLQTDGGENAGKPRIADLRRSAILKKIDCRPTDACLFSKLYLRQLSLLPRQRNLYANFAQSLHA